MANIGLEPKCVASASAAELAAVFRARAVMDN